MSLSISKYFKCEDETYFFIGKKLEIRIPRRYEVYNLLSITDTVTTLAIFDMIFDDKDTCGYVFPAVITTQPSITNKITINDENFLSCQYQTGDVFIANRTVLKQAFIAYVMFVEFVTNGKLPTCMSYDKTAFLFDATKDVCGFSPSIPHSVFELIYAHNFRDPKNLATPFRLTNLTGKPTFIGLRNVTYGTPSTTTKLIGSYFGDTVNAAINNVSDSHHDMEDLLRS